MLTCASGEGVAAGGHGPGFRTCSFLLHLFPERPCPATVRELIGTKRGYGFSLFLSMIDSPASGALVLDLAARKDELLHWNNHQFLRFPCFSSSLIAMASSRFNHSEIIRLIWARRLRPSSSAIASTCFKSSSLSSMSISRISFFTLDGSPADYCPRPQGS